MYFILHKKLHHEISLRWSKIEKNILGMKYFGKVFRLLKKQTRNSSLAPDRAPISFFWPRNTNRVLTAPLPVFSILVNTSPSPTRTQLEIRKDREISKRVPVKWIRIFFFPLLRLYHLCFCVIRFNSLDIRWTHLCFSFWVRRYKVCTYTLGIQFFFLSWNKLRKCRASMFFEMFLVMWKFMTRVFWRRP